MKTKEHISQKYAHGPVSLYDIYLEGYQDCKKDKEDNFRREAAKDILCSVLAGGIANGAKGFDAQKEELVNASIDMADELIKQIKHL